MDVLLSYVSPALGLPNSFLETHGWQLLLAFMLALAFSVFLRKTNAVIFTEFFRTKEWRLYAYIGGAAILFSLWYQVGLTVQFNAWYKEFYDLMGEAKTGKRALGEVWINIRWFGEIAFKYILVAVMTNYLTRRYGLWWREAVFNNYVRRSPSITEKIEGESQRIQEDIRDFANTVERLTIQFVRAAMTLIAFLPVLWVLSEQVDLVQLVALVPQKWHLPARVIFTIIGTMLIVWFVGVVLPAIFCWCRHGAMRMQKRQRDNRRTFFVNALAPSVAIMRRLIHWCRIVTMRSHRKLKVRHGAFFAGALISLVALVWQLSGNFDVAHMPRPLVVLALITAVGGTVASWFVGIKLPGLQYNNQVVEAALRKELVLREDNRTIRGIISTLFELFSGVRVNYNRLFLHYGYFDAWVNFYNQTMVVVPLIIMVPGLFDLKSVITLGIMMQVYNTFGEVNGSVSVVMNNWTTITEVRSIWRRLREFEAKLRLYEKKC